MAYNAKKEVRRQSKTTAPGANPNQGAPPPIRFVTAKALIVGDSGVGKTSLANRFADRAFSSTAASRGLSLHHVTVPRALSAPDLTAAIEFWDLAGQPDYNVVHQLFMGDFHVALIVIDESRNHSLASVTHWIRMVEARNPDLQAKILVSARIDRAGAKTDEITPSAVVRLGCKAFVRTSALSGAGIDELRDAVFDSIDWSQLPERTIPARWYAVEQFIHSVAQSGTTMLSVAELRKRFGRNAIAKSELDSILMRLHERGLIFLLSPRPDVQFALFNPGIVNEYGSSIILAARRDVERPGTVSEAEILRGNYDLRGIERLDVQEERIVLDSVVSLLIGAGVCQRNQGRLEFPSQVRGPVIKCFLSHNSADKPIAEALGKRLLDKGIDVWLDKWEILAGESLTSKIEEGIDGASAFLILMSPHSMKAKWVREELRIALQRRLQDPGFGLIPILLKDCEVPAFLRDYLYVDWRTPTDDAFDLLLHSLRRTKRKPQYDPVGR